MTLNNQPNETFKLDVDNINIIILQLLSNKMFNLRLIPVE